MRNNRLSNTAIGRAMRDIRKSKERAKHKLHFARLRCQKNASSDELLEAVESEHDATMKDLQQKFARLMRRIHEDDQKRTKQIPAQPQPPIIDCGGDVGV